MKRVVLFSVMLTLAIAGLSGCSSSTSPTGILAWYMQATWQSAADIPADTGLGAALVWDENDSIYALSAGDGDAEKDFWRYDISTDSWTQLSDTVISPYWATSLAWAGGDEIFATCGNGTDLFARYTISTDTWQYMASFPEQGIRRTGHSLVWPGSGDHLYLAKGDGGTVFARYIVSMDEWEYLAPIPRRMTNGNSISWGGGNRIFAATDSLEFHEYDIVTDTWAERAPYPAPVYFGSWLCYDGDESLFMTRGDTTSTVWRYDIPQDTWSMIDDAPDVFGWGGTIVAGEEALFGLPAGGLSEFWVFRP